MTMSENIMQKNCLMLKISYAIWVCWNCGEKQKITVVDLIVFNTTYI